jgi:hypothetical protein
MGSAQTWSVTQISINQVLAANLRHFMDLRGLKQPALARLSGVKQTTISLYLDPDRRMMSASGKEPSAKLRWTDVAIHYLTT